MTVRGASMARRRKRRESLRVALRSLGKDRRGPVVRALQAACPQHGGCGPAGRGQGGRRRHDDAGYLEDVDRGPQHRVRGTHSRRLVVGHVGRHLGTASRQRSRDVGR